MSIQISESGESANPSTGRAVHHNACGKVDNLSSKSKMSVREFLFSSSTQKLADSVHRLGFQPLTVISDHRKGYAEFRCSDPF